MSEKTMVAACAGLTFVFIFLVIAAASTMKHWWNFDDDIPSVRETMAVCMTVAKLNISCLVVMLRITDFQRQYTEYGNHVRVFCFLGFCKKAMYYALEVYGSFRYYKSFKLHRNIP
jgi:hypothetical protein